MKSFAVLAAAAASAAPLPAERLRCDGTAVGGSPQTDFATASRRPLFQWAPKHTEGGQSQSGFRVEIVNETEGRLWASGLVPSPDPFLRYPDHAPALEPGRSFGWRVQWADASGALSDWSPPARFRTALEASQWDGVSWLGSASSNLYVRQLSFPAGVANATLWICGLGYSRGWVNGQPLGQMVLTTAAWTNNERMNSYSSVDVTASLKQGAGNVIAVALGHGWRDTKYFARKDKGENMYDFTQRVLRAQLRVSYANGSAAVLVHTGDGQWKAEAGPITEDSVYNGEHYDARREIAGWNQFGFDASSWAAAKVVTDGPRGPMVPWTAPPVTVSRRVAPVDIWRVGGSSCEVAPEDSTVSVGCPAGQAIGAVAFASFGTPTGDCSGKLSTGSCDAKDAKAKISAQCVGKSSCTFTANDNTFGDPCRGTVKRLAVNVTCQPAPNATGGSSIFVVDFGANLAGVVHIKNMKGAAGNAVTIRHGEILQHTGLPGLSNPDPKRIYQANLRGAKATDVYTMKGDQAGEEYTPTMTYHGFRYVEVTGLQTLAASDIELLHHHSAVPEKAAVTFSSPTLTKIQKMAVGSQRSNMMTLPTDCDQRDERLGWMGDADLSCDSIALNFDAGPFLRSAVVNMATEEEADGSIPDVVPYVRYGNRPADASWSAAYVQVPYVLWKTYGDLDTVKAQLDGMVRQVQNMESQASRGIANMPAPYGDWCPPPVKMGGGQGPKPSGCFTQAFSYIGSAQLVAEMAEAVGNSSAAALCKGIASKAATEFNSVWYNAAMKEYDHGEQTAQALPLALNITPAGDRPNVTAALLAAVTAKGHHFSTGIIGFKYLFDVLHDAGFASDALAILEQTDYPSIGFEFANTEEPATENLWELPDALREGTGMNSRNHHMFSSFSHYLVTRVAGVDQLPGSVGHKNVVLRPMSGGALDVSAASVRLDTARGTVAHSWRRSGGVQCAKVSTGDVAALSCGQGGGVISDVRFASYGTPRGAGCGHYNVAPECHSTSSIDVVRARCVGRSECNLTADAATFPISSETCDGSPLRLWVDVMCSEKPSLRVSAEVPVSSTAELRLPHGALGIRDPTFANDGVVLRKWAERSLSDGGDVTVVTLGSGSHSITLNDK